VGTLDPFRATEKSTCALLNLDVSPSAEAETGRTKRNV
jgi:hypothetical protein